MTNPVKFHPIIGEKIVDEGDDETLDAAIAGAKRGLAKLARDKKAKKDAEDAENSGDKKSWR